MISYYTAIWYGTSLCNLLVNNFVDVNIGCTVLGSNPHNHRLVLIEDLGNLLLLVFGPLGVCDQTGYSKLSYCYIRVAVVA